MAQIEATADPTAFPTTFLDQCLMPVDDVFIPNISTIVRKYSNCLKHEFLKPLSDLLNWELDALQGIYLYQFRILNFHEFSNQSANLHFNIHFRLVFVFFSSQSLALHGSNATY